MYALISIILVIICIFLVLVVLVQNPKGGGLGAGFGGGASTANALGGVQKSTDFLETATWTLVIAFFVLSILSNVFIPRAGFDDVNPIQNDNNIEQLLDE